MVKLHILASWQSNHSPKGTSSPSLCLWRMRKQRIFSRSYLCQCVASKTTNASCLSNRWAICCDFLVLFDMSIISLPLTWRLYRLHCCYALMLSVRPSVRPSVCYQTCKHDVLKTIEPIWMQIDTSSPWGKDMTINFGVQEVKGQGHTRVKIDLVAWRTHHSNPLESNSFSSFTFIVNIAWAGRQRSGQPCSGRQTFCDVTWRDVTFCDVTWQTCC